MLWSFAAPAALASGAPPPPPTSPANVPLGAPILCFLANEFTRRPYLGGGKLPSRPGFNSSPGPLFNQGPAVTALSGVWGRSGEQGQPPAPPAPGAITQSLPIGFLASAFTLYPSSPHSIPAPPQRTFKNTSLYFSAQNLSRDLYSHSANLCSSPSSSRKALSRPQGPLLPSQRLDPPCL